MGFKQDDGREQFQIFWTRVRTEDFLLFFPHVGLHVRSLDTYFFLTETSSRP